MAYSSTPHDEVEDMSIISLPLVGHLQGDQPVVSRVCYLTMDVFLRPSHVVNFAAHP
jgi:hypothetical protein